MSAAVYIGIMIINYSQYMMDDYIVQHNSSKSQDYYYNINNIH